MDEKGEDIVEVHPCTENGLVTLEAKINLANLFESSSEELIDPLRMCSSLRFAEFAEDLKCSEEMGYALSEWKGKRIHIFKSGKVIIRRADDKEDATRTLKLVARALWSSIKCECSNPLIFCTSGACDYCSKKICRPQAKPPFERVHSFVVIKGSQILEHVENISTRTIFQECLGKLDHVIDILKEGEEKEEEVEESISLAKKLASSFVLKSDKGLDASLGLVLMGLIENVESIFKGISAVKRMPDLKQDLYHQAKEIAFSSYEGWRNGKINAVPILLKKYEKFEANLGKGGEDEALNKIARRGVYIARLLQKPFEISR